VTPADEALSTLSGLQNLLLAGGAIRADVAKVIRDVTVERTIEGVSTLTLEIHDDAGKLLKSGLLSERTTMSLDDYAFELVQVRKAGPGLTVVLEDLPVAALRRRSDPVKAAPGTSTHVDFSKRLVAEEAWLDFWAPVKAAGQARVELARGAPADGDEAEEREDSWVALGRLADERGWRRFIKGKGTVAYVPETYLAAQDPSYRFKETTGGVDFIDFDFDTGKPVATVKVAVRASRWAVPVGATVEIVEMGPANGVWVVASISRSLFDLSAQVALTKARPVLPEPEPAATPAASEVESGSGFALVGATAVGPKAVSLYQFIWPVRGKIVKPWGPKEDYYGRYSNHTGVDIAAAEGTRVEAAKDGTVTYVGISEGYGNAVYIDHGAGTTTRYAHLSTITTRRGVRVSRGDKIGEVGKTGTASGPHLHFEVLVARVSRDPERYLP
jgi:murein DD-endopeptidase MepM/ murein hydrolase activator NlpD